MLEFAGQTVAQTHGPLMMPAPLLPVRRVKYWDVEGEEELISKPAGRPIVVSIILHDGYDKFEDFRKALDKLEAQLGRHGELKETGAIKQTLKNVTFDAMEPIPLTGQEEPGPIRDIGVLTRTLKNGNEQADNGWFAAFLLRFYQLKA